MLLLGRLWWHDRRAKRYHAPHGHSVHWHVMRTILHSEAAYSLGVVLNLAACAARSQLVLLTSCVLPPLIVRTPSISSGGRIGADMSRWGE